MSSNRRQQMREEVLEGRPVTSFEIIDAHCHLGYWQAFNNPWRTAEDMVRSMDIVGARCCVASAHAGIGPDFRLGNDQVIHGMREFPGRILGYCCVNPNYPVDETRDEIRRCFDAGMTAIKFHPSVHACRADAEGYLPAWEFAQEHSLAILSHTGVGDRYCGIGIFDQLAADYPQVSILLGHSGFGYEGGRQSIELANERPNVYLDITSSISYRGLLERMVEGAGADRVVFGTDMPFMDGRPQVGRTAFSDLDDDALELVLSGNTARIMGIH